MSDSFEQTNDKSKSESQRHLKLQACEMQVPFSPARCCNLLSTPFTTLAVPKVL